MRLSHVLKGFIVLVAAAYTIWAFVNFFYEPVVTITQQQEIVGHGRDSLWDKAFTIFYHLFSMSVLLCIPLILLYRMYSALSRVN